MTDYIYNSITELPDDVLKGNIRVFNRILGITKRADIKDVIVGQIRRWKQELARRQPDSLYVTNPDGTVELVNDIGEI